MLAFAPCPSEFVVNLSHLSLASDDMSGRGQHDDDNVEMMPAEDDSEDESVNVPSFVKVRAFFSARSG